MRFDLLRAKLSKVAKTIYIVLLFCFTLAILFVVIPKKSSFKYEYQPGLPWSHETLFAPHNFAILRGDAAITREKDSLLRSDYTPIFNIDRAVLDGVILELKDDSLDLNKIEPILKEVYSKGIVLSETKFKDHLSSADRVYIRDNSNVEVISKDSIFTLKTAYLHFKKLGVDIDPNIYIKPNLEFDKVSSDIQREELEASVSIADGVVLKGERIVSQGQIIDEKVSLILYSLKSVYKPAGRGDDQQIYITIGYILFLISTISMIFLYGLGVHREIFRSTKKINLLMSLVIIFAILAFFVKALDSLELILFPITIVGVIVHSFIDRRIAIFTNTVLALLIGFFAPNPYEYVLLQFVAGTVTIVSLRRMQKRAQFIATAFYQFLALSITYIGLSLISNGSFESIDLSFFKWFGLNSVLLMLSQPLSWLIEKFFGFVSDTSLIEYSDTNHKLLRELSEKAPGTFHHSLQVSNLAEQVAIKLGANSNLVRAGALYHDIGKLSKAEYYTENQTVKNALHQQMKPEESAGIIISHVTEGIAMAKKHGLPKSIIDFIASHHGTSTTGYFYAIAKKDRGDEVKIEDFTYPGPIPQTIEATLVSLADGIEAASRSLPNKDRDNLKGVVDMIIDSKVKSGQLEDSPVTFKQIKQMKELFLEKLLTIYHVRIEYPKDKVE